MKCRSYSANYSKTILTVGFRTFWVVEQMLTYSRVMFKSSFSSGGARWLVSLSHSLLAYARRHLLFYPVTKPLRCASYVPGFTTARVFIYYETVLCGRHTISIRKDSVTTHNNIVVYQYSCRCLLEGECQQRLKAPLSDLLGDFGWFHAFYTIFTSLTKYTT